MAHTQDVIFTEQGLAEFIQQIRQNPEMVYKVRAATNDEIERNNYYIDENGQPQKKKLEEGYIPGKGLAIIQANGDKTLVPVGSNVEIPAFDEIVNDQTIQDGTISFLIDEQIMTIPIKGLIGDWANDTYVPVNGNRKIPNKDAIEGYVQSYVQNYIQDYTTFIPGHATKMTEDTNTPVWQVQTSTTNQAEMALKALKVYGAVFNDYAEYRMAIANAGRCVIEKGDGTLALSTQRLQLGGNIVSDTFGFAIGETNNAKCPIAVCGRVLAYPNEPTWTYQPGAAVCSGPNGTISLMTREEIKEWPDAIIGYVSEVPTYETWGTDNIKVNGRIWIKVA